ncbi:MAG: hypothetical protein ACK5OS_06685 [Chryseotalea sp.]
MKIKTVHPINFLHHQAETTIQQLSSFFPVSAKLMKEAARYGLTLAGPMHWHYKNFMGDETQPFILEMSLPVVALPEKYEGEFMLKRTEPFRCVSAVHEGKWTDIPNRYASIMQFMEANSLQPSIENRELYIQVDFENQDANVTEIQMGIL